MWQLWVLCGWSLVCFRCELIVFILHTIAKYCISLTLYYNIYFSFIVCMVLGIFWMQKRLLTAQWKNIHGARVLPSVSCLLARKATNWKPVRTIQPAWLTVRHHVPPPSGLEYLHWHLSFCAVDKFDSVGRVKSGGNILTYMWTWTRRTQILWALLITT